MEQQWQLLNTIVYHPHRGYHHVPESLSTPKLYEEFLQSTRTAEKFLEFATSYLVSMRGDRKRLVKGGIPKGQLGFLDQSLVIGLICCHLILHHPELAEKFVYVAYEFRQCMEWKQEMQDELQRQQQQQQQ